jgi:N-acetylglucosamine-6-phosphate deacetylase
MKVICIKNGTLVTPFGCINDSLWIEDSIITHIGYHDTYKKFDLIDASSCYITPGLIDIHIHGGAGCNFIACTTDELDTLKKDLLKHGITKLIPTVMTAPADQMLNAIDVLSRYIDKQDPYLPCFTGINVEGPFLSPQRKGIHPSKHLDNLSIETVNKYINDKVKILTLAPELDKTGQVIPFLTKKGIIVSLGHSISSYEKALQASQSGAKLVTHIYNAMEPFHHRNPGIMAAALVDDSLFVELIADGIHVHPGAIKLAIKAKPVDKVILISDSIALRDSPETSYSVSGEKITIRDNKAVNNSGVLSGSIVTVDQCIRNLVQWGIADFPTAVTFATFNPAKLLGIYQEKGCMYHKCRADLVIWDKQTLEIKNTIINGRIT